MKKMGTALIMVAGIMVTSASFAFISQNTYSIGNNTYTNGYGSDGYNYNINTYSIGNNTYSNGYDSRGNTVNCSSYRIGNQTYTNCN